MQNRRDFLKRASMLLAWFGCTAVVVFLRRWCKEEYRFAVVFLERLG